MPAAHPVAPDPVPSGRCAPGAAAGGPPPVRRARPALLA